MEPQSANTSSNSGSRPACKHGYACWHGGDCRKSKRSDNSRNEKQRIQFKAKKSPLCQHKQYRQTFFKHQPHRRTKNFIQEPKVPALSDDDDQNLVLLREYYTSMEDYFRHLREDLSTLVQTRQNEKAEQERKVAIAKQEAKEFEDFKQWKAQKLQLMD